MCWSILVTNALNLLNACVLRACFILIPNNGQGGFFGFFFKGFWGRDVIGTRYRDIKTILKQLLSIVRAGNDEYYFGFGGTGLVNDIS